MKFRIFPCFAISIYLLLSLSGCTNGSLQSAGESPFSTEDLVPKWGQQDSAYLREYINRLDDRSLSDADFFDRIVELSNVSGFVFGNVDFAHEDWTGLSAREKQNFRSHVAWVHSLYSQSSLFIQEGSWDNSQIFQDWYLNQYDLYANSLPLQDTLLILKHLDAIALGR